MRYSWDVYKGKEKMQRDEYLQRLEKAVQYIEAHLHADISLTDVSRRAFSSLSHFHRIFFFMTGLTMKEYIRRRRLSKAAEQLLCGNEKIIEIALDCGYEAPETFTRAFKGMFNCSPSQFRKSPPEHKLQGRIDLKSILDAQSEKGRTLPGLHFALLSKMKIVGKQTKTTLRDHQQTRDIPQFFETCMVNGIIDEIPGKELPVKLFGVYTDMSDDEEFCFTVGCSVAQEEALPKDFVKHILPAYKYACFTHAGAPSQLEETWRYIYGQWLPTSNHDRGKGYDFEIYGKNETQIYIPIKDF